MVVGARHRRSSKTVAMPDIVQQRQGDQQLETTSVPTMEELFKRSKSIQEVPRAVWVLWCEVDEGAGL